MINIVVLLAAAAVISQQPGFEANAQVDTPNVNNDIDNNLLPNPPKPPRRLRKYARLLSQPEEEIRRVVGEKVELECVALGNPVPSVRWEKNGQTVDLDQTNEMLPPNPFGIGRLMSKLIITSGSPGEDHYSCIASTGLHTASASTTVYTLPSDDGEEDQLALEKYLHPTKPTITYFYNFILQDIGTPMVLPCRVHSFTKSLVLWYHGEHYIRNNERMTVLPSGDLAINEVDWSDMGNFTCSVKNLYGKDSLTTFVYPIKQRKNV